MKKALMVLGLSATLALITGSAQARHSALSRLLRWHNLHRLQSRQQPVSVDLYLSRRQLGPVFSLRSPFWSRGLPAARLPEPKHQVLERQVALEAFILVATLGGPTMLARIGVMWALNRNVELVFDTSRKDHYWGRRKLARGR